jgi:hypothetical protein
MKEEILELINLSLNREANSFARVFMSGSEMLKELGNQSLRNIVYYGRPVLSALPDNNPPGKFLIFALQGKIVYAINAKFFDAGFANEQNVYAPPSFPIDILFDSVYFSDTLVPVGVSPFSLGALTVDENLFHFNLFLNNELASYSQAIGFSLISSSGVPSDNNRGVGANSTSNSDLVGNSIVLKNLGGSVYKRGLVVLLNPFNMRSFFFENSRIEPINFLSSGGTLEVQLLRTGFLPQRSFVYCSPVGNMILDRYGLSVDVNTYFSGGEVYSVKINKSGGTVTVSFVLAGSVVTSQTSVVSSDGDFLFTAITDNYDTVIYTYNTAAAAEIVMSNPTPVYNNSGVVILFNGLSISSGATESIVFERDNTFSFDGGGIKLIEFYSGSDNSSTLVRSIKRSSGNTISLAVLNDFNFVEISDYTPPGGNGGQI